MKKYDAKNGYYGQFGGRYVPEMLIPNLENLEKTYLDAINNEDFIAEYKFYLKEFVGRPSPLIYAENLTKICDGAKIFLKNEGNNLTGSHKINHCLFQILLAKKLGKTRIICETGAGQHGVATAVVCAKFGLKCDVFMGYESVKKQYPNVFWMEQLGAKVNIVKDGNAGLTEAVNAAMGAWLRDLDAYYLLGSALGPSPYPEIIRFAQKIVGKEISSQLKEKYQINKPDYVVACIGGGSNAIGAFDYFLEDESVNLVGVEAGGVGDKNGEHAVRLGYNQSNIGIFEGFKTYFLQTKTGSLSKTTSIAAGLDYVGISPIHAYLFEQKRLQIQVCTDKMATAGFQELAKNEGILCALESAHAVAIGIKIAKELTKNQSIVINVSGRADNYLFNIANTINPTEFHKNLKSYLD